MADRVEVSRRIAAPAARIFRILADPRRHTDFDGSGMLRGAVADDVISGAGEAFAMKMFYEDLGDYVVLNHVVEYEDDRRIGWEPSPGDAAATVPTDGGQYRYGERSGQRWSYQLTPEGSDATVVTQIYDYTAGSEQLRRAVRNGERWVEAMEKSLAMLDELCTKTSPEASAST